MHLEYLGYFAFTTVTVALNKSADYLLKADNTGSHLKMTSLCSCPCHCTQRFSPFQVPSPLFCHPYLTFYVSVVREFHLDFFDKSG